MLDVYGDGPNGIKIESLEQHAQKYDVTCWGWLSSTPVNENYGPIVGGLINKGTPCSR